MNIITQAQIDTAPQGQWYDLGPGRFNVRGHWVHANEGSKVWAYEGSEVTAYEGSLVYATKNSKVRAFKGSLVYAFKGSVVHANEGSVVHANEGSVVHANEGSVVHANEGSVVWDLVGTKWVKRETSSPESKTSQPHRAPAFTSLTACKFCPHCGEVLK